MPTIGEKPGKGRYMCTKCGLLVILDDDMDRLSPCSNPKCDGTEFESFALLKKNTDNIF